MKTYKLKKRYRKAIKNAFLYLLEFFALGICAYSVVFTLIYYS